jgi:hypothetical protein
MDILAVQGHSPRRMQAEAPNWTYFRAVAGRWGGPLDFAITDWRAFRAARMPLGDRLSLLAMAWLTRLVGACQLDTGVDVASGAARDEVVHTTRVSKWGVTLMRSVDTLRLDRNGRDMTMRIELGLWPALRRARVAAETPAAVDASGLWASYRFPWFGVEMRQRGERSADGCTVTLTQETSFSRGVQVLRRR